MDNETIIYSYYKQLLNKIENGDLLEDKSGTKIAEILAPRIELDPRQEVLNFETRKAPLKYIKKEEEWYSSHELNIDRVGDVKIWRGVADENEEINSNYGNLVFSRNNFSQFLNVIKTLERHKESRQGIIIYTRPSIHYEWNSLGASDFICTNYQQFFIRHNKLHCVTSMRSNDSWFGLASDIPWFHLVIRKVYSRLATTYQELEYGKHIFIPNSFHIYERHFDRLKKLIEENKHLDQGV